MKILFYINTNLVLEGNKLITLVDEITKLFHEKEPLFALSYELLKQTILKL